MMVIIHGEDRSEYCKVAKKHKEKHFFETRNQLYRVRPEGLARCRIDYFGEIRSDEVVAYPENEIIPYQVKGGVIYEMDKFFMDLDNHKQMTSGSWFGKAKTWFSGGSGKDLKEFITNPTAWMVILAIIIILPTVIHF